MNGNHFFLPQVVRSGKPAERVPTAATMPNAAAAAILQAYAPPVMWGLLPTAVPRLPLGYLGLSSLPQSQFVHPALYASNGMDTLHLQAMLETVRKIGDIRPNLATNAQRLFSLKPCSSMAEGESGTSGQNVKSKKKRKLEEDLEGKDHKKAKQETKALKAKRPGFTEERYNETSYYIENGLRKVYPYYFTFTTFCKGRWVGQPILDVFAKEFRAHPPKEYERCIKAGTLTVNYKPVDIDYKLQHNDLLANVVHRHEVPVANLPIQILHVSDDMVVVDKPPSIPVHPCGRYRHNTVVFILAKEFNLKNLRTIHRLDRLTSGLLLFGRTLEKARQLEHEIRSRLVCKEYVCRVEGTFPSESIVCEQPIEVVSYKIGVCRVGPKGKDCKTEFHKLSSNGKSSVVLCRPRTGRMHQIRVHLQYLGYPILNDPLYNHVVFGEEKGKNGEIGKSNEQLIADLIQIHNAENWLGMDNENEDFILPNLLPSENESCADGNNSLPSVEKPISQNDVISITEAAPPAEDIKISSEPTEPKTTNEDEANTNATLDLRTVQELKIDTDSLPIPKPTSFDISKMTKDQHCYECKAKFRDPKPKDLVMYLHAWKYKGQDWSFETQLPEWAKEDWKEEFSV